MCMFMRRGEFSGLGEQMTQCEGCGLHVAGTGSGLGEIENACTHHCKYSATH